MPTKRKEKLLSVDALRHAEYYDIQETFDRLYTGSSEGKEFTDLMSLILARENILLAYRNMKTNKGSNTPGTDGLTIEDIGQLTPEEVVSKVRFILTGSQHGYRPRPVRRKEIPKPNGSTRPLGIPCIWDRLIQQSIRQVLEPICEAKFSNNSYGFRPDRSTENAIASVYKMMQISHLPFVVEFDIKGFFDNVNHSKLIRQMWSMGIRDPQLLYITRRILTAPIRMPDGTTVIPEKGTPQGGLISPLLANIVLNELDQWIDGQWENHPVTRQYAIRINANGSENKGSGYRGMRGTRLKEMHIVRYADDFRIFCRTKEDAEKVLIAVTQWLAERLKLEVSPEKTRIVDVRERYSEFLGFKIRVHKKGPKYVVESHISDKQSGNQRNRLTDQAKRIARPSPGKTEYEEIRLYNAMVMGMHNYYRIATDISIDCRDLHRAVMTVLTNRLGTDKGCRLVRQGRPLTSAEQEYYGASKELRYVAGTAEPVYPVGFIQTRKPMHKRRSINRYTPAGRAELHDNLRINVRILRDLMRTPQHGNSAELSDNKLSLYSAQFGQCAITGEEFRGKDEIHCHHKQPRRLGGNDAYGNLVLVSEPAHILIHATDPDVISRYMGVCNLNKDQRDKLNKLRELAGNAPIAEARQLSFFD